MSSGWSSASHAHYQMGRSAGATLSFYDWPLITAALKAAARFFSDTSAHCQMDIFIGTIRIVYAVRRWRSGRWFALQSAGCFAIWKKSREMSQPACNNRRSWFTRECADKTGAARSVRVALTTCCQFMLCDKLSLFRLRLRWITILVLNHMS